MTATIKQASTRKHFDRELYNKYDVMAKAKANEIFATGGWTIENNEKKMGVDFLVFDEDDNHVAYLEVEVKTNWEEKEFPYSDVQWPERKWKYCNLDKPTIFMMFNIDASHYLTARGETLLSSKLEMVRNKYVRYGENFFKVPVSKITFDNVYKELGKL